MFIIICSYTPSDIPNFAIATSERLSIFMADKLDLILAKLEKLDHIEHKVNSLQAEVSEIKDDIHQVKTTVKAHDARFDQLESEVKGVKDDVQQVKTTLKAHDARFDKMEKRFDKLEAEVSEIKDDLYQVKTTVKAHDARFDKMEREVIRTGDHVEQLLRIGGDTRARVADLEVSCTKTRSDVQLLTDTTLNISVRQKEQNLVIDSLSRNLLRHDEEIRLIHQLRDAI